MIILDWFLELFFSGHCSLPEDSMRTVILNSDSENATTNHDRRISSVIFLNKKVFI